MKYRPSFFELKENDQRAVATSFSFVCFFLGLVILILFPLVILRFVAFEHVFDIAPQQEPSKIRQCILAQAILSQTHHDTLPTRLGTLC